VSPLSRDELRVVLFGDQLQLVRLSSRLTFKGWQYQVLDQKLVPYEAGGSSPWEAALAKLETVLSRTEIKPERASVVLGNHCVRYAIVEVDKSLQKEEEQIAFVRHRFGQLYGASADSWDLRFDQEFPGAPFLASAVDAQLVARLRELFAMENVKVQSIQPALMKAYNQCRQSLAGKNAWFVIPEQGCLCMVWLSNGYPVSVRSVKTGADWLQQLPGIVERESYLSEFDISSKEVLLWSFDQNEKNIHGGGLAQIKVVKPAVPAGLAGQYDEQYTLAMGG
jgi:hypothetical protein